MTVVYSTAQMNEIAAEIGHAIKQAMAGIAITDQNTGEPLKIWTGTQAEYDAVTTKDSGTLYVVKA